MRYETTVVNDTVVLRYEQGYTKVECNEKTGKTIVINETGDRWIEEQFDRIFGLGEFKKTIKHRISHVKEKNPNNPYCIKHTMVFKYIPKEARKDLNREMEKHLPGIKKSDLIGKYFK